MVSFRRIQLWVKKVPWFVWRLAVIGVIAGGFAIAWWYPKSHSFLATQLGLSGMPSQVIAADVAPSAVVDRVNSLEQEITKLEADAQQNKAEMASLQSDFQQATSEVAASNAELQKQTREINSVLSGMKINGSAASTGEVVSSSPNPTAPGKISINTGTLAQLETLTGIGPTYAQRIIDYRTTKGPFKTLEDLQSVNGIGPATYDKLKDQIEL